MLRQQPSEEYPSLTKSKIHQTPLLRRTLLVIDVLAQPRRVLQLVSASACICLYVIVIVAVAAAAAIVAATVAAAASAADASAAHTTAATILPGVNGKWPIGGQYFASLISAGANII